HTATKPGDSTRKPGAFDEPQQTAPAAPVASAAGATQTSPAGVHEPATRLICTGLAGVIGQLPPESVPGRVCKLVNGWD
ncbi:hypothetical protein I3W98_36980, partial [Streptomyces cavourensis]|nr:hypothetical protein [Streptomyces cavourensis]